MLDYEHPYHKYDEWYELLKDYVENNYAGTIVEIEEAQSGIVYESFDRLYDEDYMFSVSITINKDLYPRTKLYALLHEVGHIERMVDDCNTKTFFYSYLDNVPDDATFRTRTIVEEVLAWHKAEMLANELDIKLETRAWQREIEKAIRLYSLWCAQKGDRNAKEVNKS